VRVPHTGESILRDVRCPYGKPGERLWCKEMWAETADEYGTPIIAYRAGGERIIGRDGSGSDFTFDGKVGDYAADPWKSPRFMPRWTSRITLEITDVRVERLRDISEADAKAEGCEPVTGMSPNEWCRGCPVIKVGRNKVTTAPYGLAYMRLWESINGKSHPWESNPLVWAITFKRIEQE
jgi:hypothetical protein